MLYHLTFSSFQNISTTYERSYEPPEYRCITVYELHVYINIYSLYIAIANKKIFSSPKLELPIRRGLHNFEPLPPQKKINEEIWDDDDDDDEDFLMIFFGLLG